MFINFILPIHRVSGTGSFRLEARSMSSTSSVHPLTDAVRLSVEWWIANKDVVDSDDDFQLAVIFLILFLLQRRAFKEFFYWPSYSGKSYDKRNVILISVISPSLHFMFLSVLHFECTFFKLPISSSKQWASFAIGFSVNFFPVFRDQVCLAWSWSPTSKTLVSLASVRWPLHQVGLPLCHRAAIGLGWVLIHLRHLSPPRISTQVLGTRSKTHISKCSTRHLIRTSRIIISSANPIQVSGLHLESMLIFSCT